MPWKQLPPEWWSAKWDELFLFFSILSAVALGMATKVASEVKDGEREKILSSRLLLDVPAVLMMASVTYGVGEYLDLSTGAVGSVGAVLGYLGPRTAYLLIDALAHRIRGGKS
ncbi:hypothetical protein [uncultured Halomonas sp.]|uniref:hypothetical protein n=1 Tax=uncultured Halomonas sp. TaxID=173971 RepID=UPI0026108375|nr:hypothetical protein [uncultured Halomonas sp.]